MHEYMNMDMEMEMGIRCPVAIQKLNFHANIILKSKSKSKSKPKAKNWKLEARSQQLAWSELKALSRITCLWHLSLFFCNVPSDWSIKERARAWHEDECFLFFCFLYLYALHVLVPVPGAVCRMVYCERGHSFPRCFQDSRAAYCAACASTCCTFSCSPAGQVQNRVRVLRSSSVRTAPAPGGVGWQQAGGIARPHQIATRPSSELAPAPPPAIAVGAETSLGRSAGSHRRPRGTAV